MQPFATTRMGLEGIWQRDKYQMLSLKYVESKKAKCLETEGKMVISRGWGWKVGGDGVMLIQGDKLPVIR